MVKENFENSKHPMCLLMRTGAFFVYKRFTVVVSTIDYFQYSRDLQQFRC